MKMTERLQQWGGRTIPRFSFRNATIIVCFLNLITALFLIHGFLSPSTSNRSDSVVLKYMKESEEVRRDMEPVELIKRVREIEREAREEVESVQEKDANQSAALDLISRLNNHRSYSDADNQKALEEWRKRKMEREGLVEMELKNDSISLEEWRKQKMERSRQRGLGRNGTQE